MMDAVSECIDTDLTSWKIGPYHGALPGPIQVHMELDGEIIVSAKVETGFLHRGLEKELELHSLITSFTSSGISDGLSSLSS